MPTLRLPGPAVADRLGDAFPDAVAAATADSVTVEAHRLPDVARFLRDDPQFDCKYLNCITAVDYVDHFEVVYNLMSLAQNRMITLKVRADHDDPVVPSVSGVWIGAHLQEREAYDLMGIRFSGHPNLKRLFLWEGFPGHPLRKDFLSLPGGLKPGLARFPKEVPGQSGQEFRPDVGSGVRPPESEV